MHYNAHIQKMETAVQMGRNTKLYHLYRFTEASCADWTAVEQYLLETDLLRARIQRRLYNWYLSLS